MKRLKRLNYYLQKGLGALLSEPIIPGKKTTGFSLVKSEKANTVLEENTRVYAPFFLHDVTLGEYSYIAKNSNIANTEIGRFCSIGPNFCCGMGIHPIDGISTSPMFYSSAKQNGMTLSKVDKVQESKRTKIGNDVFIGANVTVLDGATIADGAVIGAGAVVVKDIPPYAVAVGVPAKVVKYRFTSEQIDILMKRKWWNDPIAEMPKVEHSFFDINRFLND